MSEYDMGLIKKMDKYIEETLKNMPYSDGF